MDKIELIEKYFTDTLTDEERLLFENLLQNDREFKEEFLFHKDVKKALALNKRESIRQTMKELDKEMDEKKSVFTLRNWLIAASVVALFGLSYFFYNQYQSNQPESLFTQNFQPYKNVVHPIVRGEKDENIEAKAFSAYQNGDYYKAINLFNSIESPDVNSVNFYKAMSFLALGKHSEAIDLLLPLATQKDPENAKFKWNAVSNWYLGLAYLGNHENKKAISQFLVVVNHPTCDYKKEEAKILLSKLKAD